MVLQSQSAPFPTKDLIIAESAQQTTPTVTLEQCKGELSLLRGELEGKLSELEALKEQLAVTRTENEAKTEELGQAERELEGSRQQRSLLQTQVCLNDDDKFCTEQQISITVHVDVIC